LLLKEWLRLLKFGRASQPLERFVCEFAGGFAGGWFPEVFDLRNVPAVMKGSLLGV
jgi:hypothetical protein